MPRGIPSNPDTARRPGMKPHTETIQVKDGHNTREVKVERRERRNTGIDSSRLKFDRPEYQREGYARRWAADRNNRLKELFDQDYDYVLDDKGQKMTQFGGTDRFGNKFDHYLMEKPLDWYEEDKLKKLEKSSLEQETKSNNAISGASKGLNMYRPKTDDNVALAEID